jgi:predicted Fe-Mo cluster-binding NifX family protein
MKVVFTTSGNKLSDPLDRRFGRAPKFLVYDIESECFEVISNEQNLNAAQGAGIQSAETVARIGCDAVVSGHCGPKAFRVLSAAGIKIYTSEETTIQEALALFKDGKLTESLAADVDGHW